MKITPATPDDLSRWHSDYLQSGGEDSLHIAICFGGDRLSAVADGGAFFAEIEGKVVGVVSWSPTGEYDGPNIVGLWVRKEYRRRVFPQYDLAGELLMAAINALIPHLEGREIRVDVTPNFNSPSNAASVCSRARLGDYYDYLDVYRW